MGSSDREEVPVKIDRQIVLELLRQLVAIDSVNPSLVPGVAALKDG